MKNNLTIEFLSAELSPEDMAKRIHEAYGIIIREVLRKKALADKADNRKEISENNVINRIGVSS